MTDFTPCPKTIRLCIEALPKIPPHAVLSQPGWNNAILETRKALEALLPDEAEELVREWMDSPEGSMADINERDVATAFLKWAINQGKVRP